MAGSIRQRGRNSWQIRAYAGIDPDTGQRRQLTRTVQGSWTQARREHRSLAALANVGRSVGARTTLGELLDRWFAANEANWATTGSTHQRIVTTRPGRLAVLPCSVWWVDNAATAGNPRT
jgi:hypothetical protein